MAIVKGDLRLYGGNVLAAVRSWRALALCVGLLFVALPDAASAKLRITGHVVEGVADQIGADRNGMLYAYDGAFRKYTSQGRSAGTLAPADAALPPVSMDVDLDGTVYYSVKPEITYSDSPGYSYGTTQPSRLERITPSGGVSTFSVDAFHAIAGVAVGREHVYVLQSPHYTSSCTVGTCESKTARPGRVYKLSKSGATVGQWDVAPPGSSAAPDVIDADPVTNEVYVGSDQGLSRYTSGGALVSRSGRSTREIHVTADGLVWVTGLIDELRCCLLTGFDRTGALRMQMENEFNGAMTSVGGALFKTDYVGAGPAELGNTRNNIVRIEDVPPLKVVTNATWRQSIRKVRINVRCNLRCHTSILGEVKAGGKRIARLPARQFSRAGGRRWPVVYKLKKRARSRIARAHARRERVRVYITARAEGTYSSGFRKEASHRTRVASFDKATTCQVVAVVKSQRHKRRKRALAAAKC
ncbi:MAG TPA: hypothetical protein VHG52_14965 [Thermomicrobiales bacterium]|nr:hypothetical protein [Thermomicrobiales bacterium]